MLRDVMWCDVLWCDVMSCQSIQNLDLDLNLYLTSAKVY